MAYGLPALTYEGVYSVELTLLDQIAEETIRSQHEDCRRRRRRARHGRHVHHAA